MKKSTLYALALVLGVAFSYSLPSLAYASDWNFQDNGGDNVTFNNSDVISDAPVFVVTYNACARISGYTGSAPQIVTGTTIQHGGNGFTFDLLGHSPECLAGQADGQFFFITDAGYFFYSIVSGTYQYDGAGPASTSTLTRIDTVTPNNSTHATSTSFTFGATGYINDSDFISTDMKVGIKYKSSSCTANQLVGPYAALEFGGTCQQGELLFPISSSGHFTVSTTTSIQEIGKYTLTTSIQTPTFSFLGFNFGNKTLIATSTTFVVASTTAYDDFASTTDAQLNSIISTYNATTCSPVSGSFDLGACAMGLIVPNGQAFDAYAQLPVLVEGKFPFSYVASIGQTWSSLIASSTANSPTLGYNFHDVGLGSTTSMGNFLPNLTTFSASTTKQYFPSGTFDLLKNLASIALIAGLFADMFFTTRNMIRT